MWYKRSHSTTGMNLIGYIQTCQTLTVSGKFYLPEKFYGREAELALLCKELHSVSNKKSKKSINFVSGVSGCGKTGLILEVRHKAEITKLTRRCTGMKEHAQRTPFYQQKSINFQISPSNYSISRSLLGLLR